MTWRHARPSRITVCLLIGVLVGGVPDAVAQVPTARAVQLLNRQLNEATAPGPIEASIGRVIVAAQPPPSKPRRSCAKWLIGSGVVGAAAALGLGAILLARAGGSEYFARILTGMTVVGLGAGLIVGDMVACQ